MRIATWNVNSIRTRIDRVVDVLQRHDLDVLALQETKCRDDQFPFAALEAAGYEVVHWGLSQWNGVALVSRVGLIDVETDFGQPGFVKEPEDGVAAPQEARAISAVCGAGNGGAGAGGSGGAGAGAGVRVWSLYVPHGRALGDPHYQYKLAFYEALAQYGADELARNPMLNMVLTGDFNVAPRDEDVWDMAAFAGKTHVSEPERAAFSKLEQVGFVDVTRDLAEGQYTYWDYQRLRFPKNEGMRIDFQLASPAMSAAAVAAQIDREERKGKGASDHVPVIVDYAVDDFDV